MNQQTAAAPRLIGRLLFIAGVVGIVLIDGAITVYLGRNWQIAMTGFAPIVTVLDLIAGHNQAPPAVALGGLALWLLLFALRWRNIGLEWASLSLAFLPVVNLVLGVALPPGYRHTRYFNIAGRLFLVVGVAFMLLIAFIGHGSSP